jgi:hypothetical protein
MAKILLWSIDLQSRESMKKMEVAKGQLLVKD